MKSIVIGLGAAVCAALPGLAAAQDSAFLERTPMPVINDYWDQQAACSVAGGDFREESQDAVFGVDLNGDRIDDWVVDDGRLICEGAWSLFGGSGGAGLRIYAGGPGKTATPAFQHMVHGQRLIEDEGGWTLYAGVGGPLCGQRVTESTSRADMISCWRPLDWQARTRRFDFAPVSAVLNEDAMNDRLRQALVGRWSETGAAACEPGAMVLNDDGSIAVGAARGAWSQEYGLLVVRFDTPNGRLEMSSPVDRIGRDALVIQWSVRVNDGEAQVLAPRTVTRCA